ncbi:hypothetical protein ACFPT7_04980 [Acidicapsa dinghuensis]|uniref:Uncharacterized protein n=1 Tax=Acidicapsa dinghuensis TaxID=2218256 RepID=A0ABW1EBF7_9BACT|nr:hypothetical protein [Acidicapsa dinghuensis]
MVVQVANQRRRTTGLHVGDGNVQRFFPPEVPVVELELDHLRIVCNLKPEFWAGEPEIDDERLVCWLESKRMSGKLASKPAPLALMPAGEHAFRLIPIGHNEVRTTPYPVGFSG